MKWIALFLAFLATLIVGIAFANISGVSVAGVVVLVFISFGLMVAGSRTPN